MKNKFKVLCGAVALSMAGQVLADTTWTVASNYGTISSEVTVAAYSNTGGANNSTSAVDNAPSQTIQLATWNGSYGGVKNLDACSYYGCDYNEGVNPEHSIDNEQRYDMVLLSFTSAVKLTQVKLGWTQTDSDITLLAYTGAGDPRSNGKLVNNTYGQLTATQGWTSIGSYGDIGLAAVATNATVYSSYWLVGAYNPLAGGTKNGLDIGNDYVKLAAVTGIICPSGSGPTCPSGASVPEPGSLALFGFALMGMMGLRKRRQG